MRLLTFIFFEICVSSKIFEKDVFVHYMPWFETPEFQGYWGYHWKMNNKNPDLVTDGKREIVMVFNKTYLKLNLLVSFLIFYKDKKFKYFKSGPLLSENRPICF